MRAATPKVIDEFRKTPGNFPAARKGPHGAAEGVIQRSPLVAREARRNLQEDHVEIFLVDANELDNFQEDSWEPPLRMRGAARP